MAEIFRMPKLGMDMEEGTVTNWIKKVGDPVKKGEALAEIETDKSAVEVESPADGIVLKQYVPEWEAVPCGTPIAVIGNPGEAIPVDAAEQPVAAAAPAAPAAPAAAPAAVPAVSGTFFRMPKLGMDMEEGTVTNWIKKEGDAVKKGEAIAEIETDKSAVEVEAPADGILLKQYVPEWEAVPCGTPIAYIGKEGEAIPDAAAADAPAEAPAAEAPAQTPAAAGYTGNGTFFRMPKLGMDMEEGTVTNWIKKEGEAVKKGEALAEIETDKSAVEVESPADGIVLKQYVPEWEAVPCGTPIAFIGNAGDPIPDASAADAPAAPAAPAAPEAPAPAAQAPAAAAPKKVAAAQSAVAALTPGGRIRSSPRARRLADKEGVDLGAIAGSGEDGRILEQDVLDYMAAAPAVAPATAVRVPTETIKPLTGVRKVTARRMRQSLSNAAQTNHRVDVDVTKLIDFRKQVNARLEKDGIKVSYVDILICACAKALIEHPMANAYLMDDGLHMHNYANVGFAADTEKGLVVPVVKDADILTLPQIAQNSRALINKARQGALKGEDMSGGTFTISNLGMFEIDSFTAVLTPPETCILAVGRMADRVVVENGQMVIRPMMNLCLTYDHQVLDGAPAAKFLETIKHYIENPVWLML